MNRLIPALCLSLSVVAISLALTLRVGREPSSSGVSVAALDELVSSFDDLTRRVESLERSARRRAEETGRLEAQEAGAVVGLSTESGELGTAAGLEERFAALQARLADLEDAESIARRVHEGRVAMRRRAAKAFLEEYTDPSLSPRERQERLFEFWEQHGELVEHLVASGVDEAEILDPLLATVRDPGTELEVRVKLLEELGRSGSEQLRPPLLEIAAGEPEAPLRQQAVRNLAEHHAHDVEAQNAILQASREDPSEEVRGTASRRLEHIHDVAVRETPGSPASQLRPDEFPRGDDFDEFAEREERLERERQRAEAARAEREQEGKRSEPDED